MKYYAVGVLVLLSAPAAAQTVTCQTNFGVTTCTQSPVTQSPDQSSADNMIGGLLRGTGYGQTPGDAARQQMQNQILQQQIELQRQQIEMNRKLLERQKASEE